MPLGQPSLAEAQRVLAALRREVGDVRWARPETLHMTVHFFGSADDERVRLALDAVRPAVARAQHLEVAVDRLGAFPPRGWPRVLWLGGGSTNAELARLAADVRHELLRAGFAVDERPFRAHATLGRPRVPWPAEARRAWKAAVTCGVAPTRFTADRLTLFESVTGPEAAVYVERAVMPFGAA